MSAHVDSAWVRDQLENAGYDHRDARRQALGTSVQTLLTRLEDMDWPISERNTVIDLFARLAKGQAIAPRDVQATGRWATFRLGDFPVGTTVRVRHDAYEGSHGVEHNGMVGKLVAARGGKAVIQYAESAETSGVHHDPAKLEALVSNA